MSGSLAELSPAGIYEIGADLRALGHKTGLGWLQLAGHLRRFGSIPADERSVASILGVTVRFLRERAWPLIEDRLVLSENGRRYSCPDITPWNNRQGSTARAPDGGTVKSPRHQKASRSRWDRRNAADASESDASTHASDDASRMQPDAKTHAETMHDASDMHAKSPPFASPDASDAFAPARAPALSPLGTSVPESPENWRDSLGEREDARMHGNASTDATRMHPDASVHAPRRKQRPPTRLSAPISRDWKPTPEDALAARGRGFDPDDLAQGFVNWYLGNGEQSPDWDAKFRTWMRREKSPPIGKLQQGSIKLPIEGGVADEVDDPAATIGNSTEAQWARVRRDLKKESGEAVWRTWLAEMVLAAIEDGEVRIWLPTQFKRDWVNSRYCARLTTLWHAENPDIRRVSLEVAALERQAANG